MKLLSNTYISSCWLYGLKGENKYQVVLINHHEYTFGYNSNDHW
jgi:hypothetical protein